MLPVSSKFLAAIRGSHGIVSRARLVTPGQTGVAPTGVDLAVVEGSVTLDATADVRGTMSMTLAEPWPDGVTTAEIVPYGSEIAISRGVVYGNGVVERAPLGIFRVTNVEQGEAPNGPLTVTGQDRMSGLVEARELYPIQYQAGVYYADSIVLQLVLNVYPSAVIEWDAVPTTRVGRTIIVEDEIFPVLRDLLTSYGKVFYFDYRGVLVIRDPPSVTTSVFRVDAGRSGVLVSASRSLTRDGIYNAVVATGEGADETPPVRGVSVDLDPSSPTYFYGSFGKVPRFFSSPMMTTTAQAQAAADSMLRKSLGLPYAVDFSAVPNPALEPLDAVEVVYPDGTNQVHVMDQLSIPLTSTGALVARTRVQYLSPQVGAP